MSQTRHEAIVNRAADKLAVSLEVQEAVTEWAVRSEGREHAEADQALLRLLRQTMRNEVDAADRAMEEPERFDGRDHNDQEQWRP